MFEFFKHQAVNKPETETTNTSEESNPIQEMESELSYKSPEYAEAENVYMLNPELFISELSRVIEEGGEEGESADLYVYSADEVLPDVESTSVGNNEEYTEGVVPVVEEGVFPEEKTSPLYKNIKIAGSAISMAAALSVAACKETDKVYNFVTSLGVEKTEEKNEPHKNNLDSTSIRSEGPGKEKFKEYAKSIVPSGDMENGYINLNDETEKAQAEGVLRYFPESHTFALEVTKNPSKQGISIKGLVFYKLHKNKSPRPLISGGSFSNYTKNKKGDLRTFDYKKFDRDLRDAVPKSSFVGKDGKINNSKYENAVDSFAELNHKTLEAFIEWVRANPQHREDLYQKETKPLEGRTGVVK